MCCREGPERRALRGAESFGRVHPSSSLMNNKEKRMTSSLSDFLVTLIFCLFFSVLYPFFVWMGPAGGPIQALA